MLILTTSTSIADFRQQSEFDSYKQQTESEFEQAKNEFKLYKQRLQAAFDRYQYKSAKIWGNKNTILPNRKNWVSYQGDINRRSVVDFENGTVKIEIALPADQAVSGDSARQQLALTVLKTLEQGEDKRSIIDIAKKPIAQPRGPAVLEGQIADNRGKSINKKDYKSIAQLASQQANTRTITGNDGKKRIVYRTTLKLVPDHIKRRASKYLSQVHKYAKSQKVPAALIFTIIEIESMFNPTARSSVPAFGLMQLVPTSGALEAYRHLYKKNKIVSDTYLYNPDNNIRLGAAFIHRLYYYYLNRIDNPRSRLWATAAAYNTGASNVIRTFAGGKYSKAKFGSRKKWKAAAFNKINKMTPKQVYNYLLKRLPYKETRSYIKKIRSRIPKYEA